VEVLAQNQEGSRFHIPSRAERFRTLKALDEEIVHLTRVYLRRGEKRTSPAVGKRPIPDSYISLRDQQIYGIADKVFIPGGWGEYQEVVDAMVLKRDQLRTYAALRVGSDEDRYQNRVQWQAWSSGEPLPRARGRERELALQHLRNGKKHDRTLCLVAMNWMVFNGQHLDGHKATSIKRAVDRAYVELKGERPPPVPRGWWHPRHGLGITPGGLQMMGLAWDPVVELENPNRETIVPYHQLVDATLESSCWQGAAENWP